MNKRILYIIGGVFFIIATILLVIQLLSDRGNKYGEELQISNLSEYTNGKPTDKERLDFIKHSLFDVVKMNTDREISSDSIKDVVIRKNSFSQTFDKEKTLHTVRFIVDIKSLKQSYKASYQWVDDETKRSEITEYGTIVSCLDKEDLVYGDFDCRDGLTEESKTANPIIEHLPYSGQNYSINYNPNAYLPTLIITIKTSAADERTDSAAAIELYKTEANEWILSKGFKLEDYIIEYEIIQASLY